MGKVEQFLIKQYGEEGPPKGIDPVYLKTWDKFEEDQPNNRFATLINFFNFIKRTGIKAFSKNIEYGKFIEEQIYEDLKGPLTDSLQGIRKARVLEVFSIQKSELDVNFLGDKCVIRINMALKPKNKRDAIDQAIQRLKGFLYTGDLPYALQQRYKYKSLNGQAKTALLDFKHYFKSQNLLGRFLFAVKTSVSVSFVAAKDGFLVATIVVTLPTKPFDFVSQKQYKVLIVKQLKRILKELGLKG
jgi:hypothetical protein